MDLIKFFKINKYLLFIILIGLIIFMPLIFSKTFFSGGDTVNFSSFAYKLQKQYFQNNNQPILWNPYIFSGSPFFANVIAAPNYPLNFISIILNLPLYLWINLSFLITFIFSGIFTYLFCRKIKLTKFSSFISAIIFMFSHALLSRFSGDIGILTGFMFLSANFFFLESFFQKKNFSSAIFLSIFLALGFLAGHTQYFFYASFALTLYFLFRFIKDYKKIIQSKSLKKFIISCFFIMILFLGLIAIQFVPTLEYSKYSWRKGYSFEEASKCSLPFQQIITGIIPNFFGHRLLGTYWGSPCGELAFYLGILPLILAIFTLTLKSKTKVFFLGLAVFCILFSLGNNFPLFYIFYKFIPGFSIFNAPSRMLMVYSFAISILAGIGSEKLINPKYKNHKRNFSVILFLLFLISFINLSLILMFKNKILNFGKNLLESLYYGKYANTSLVQNTDISELFPLVSRVFNQVSLGIFIASLLIFLTGFLFYFSYKNINKKYLKFGILFILFIDILIFAHPYLNQKNIQNTYFPEADSTEDLFAPNEELLFLLSQNDSEFFRIYDREWIIPQTLIIRTNIYKTTGYDSIALKDYFNYIDLINLNEKESSKKLGILNVKYILSRTPLNNSNFLLIKKFNNSYIYKNKDFLPRFYLISNSTINNVDLIKYSPEKAIINAKGPGILVFSDTFYPGWNVYVDKKKSELLSFKNIIKSVNLGSGEHKVIFEFKPKSYLIGKIITLLAIFCILFFIIYFRFKPNKSKIQII